MPAANAALPPNRQPEDFSPLPHPYPLSPTSPTPRMMKKIHLLLPLISLLASCMVSCQQAYTSGPDTPPRAVIKDGVAITLRDQKLTVIQNGRKVKDYSISSSKFGIGGRTGSNRTPVGIHAVTKKVGDGQPKGMVFKGCRPTGEVVPVDAAGRDPIVTRVIQIAGLESFNSNSHSRRIYIHGTPEERKIGRPASYGCIRMRSNDVLDLYSRVYRGMPVAIESCSQAVYLNAEKDKKARRISIPPSIVASLPTDTVQMRPQRKYSSRSTKARRGMAARSSRSSASRRSLAKNGKKAKTNRAKNKSLAVRTPSRKRSR